MKLAIKPLVCSTAALGLIFGVAQNAQAALITGVTASTDMGSLFNDYNIANTVNGKGLPGNTPSLTGSHAVPDGLNAWAGSSTTGQITFNLNGSYNLAGFSFWNFAGGSGIQGVTVKYSTDGNTFTTITGAPTQFASSAVNVSVSPQQFSFSPVVASHVQFVVSSNHGSTFGTGFSEAQFDETPVPEPLTILGTGVVLGAIPVLKKEYAKKNKKKDKDA